MEEEKALVFKNSKEWREWLEKNAQCSQEVWLVHYKKKSGKVSITLDEAVTEALCFGWIDGKLKSIDEEKFILRYSPRKAKSVWSKINRDKAELLIAQGRVTATGLARIKEAKENGSWNGAYTNKTRDEIPEDLRHALKEDQKAWDHFENFANTYRNMYSGWIRSAKTEETRKRRITEVVRRAALNKKPY